MTRTSPRWQFVALGSLGVLAALTFVGGFLLTGLVYLATDSCPYTPLSRCDALIEPGLRRMQISIVALGMVALLAVLPRPRLRFALRATILVSTPALALLVLLTWRVPW